MAKWKGKHTPDRAPKLFGKLTNQLHRGDLLRIISLIQMRSQAAPHDPGLLDKLIYLIQNAINRFTLEDLYLTAEVLGKISPHSIDGSAELYEFAEACNLVGHRIEKVAGHQVAIAFDPLDRKNEALILLSQRHPDLVSIYPDRDDAGLIIVKLEIPPTYGLHIPVEIFNRD
ncbi:MAG: hypothetical protein WCW66_06825 [Patescibacteria group bacterium]